MSFVGFLAMALAIGCAAVLVHDLRRRRTAFGQFAASRGRAPRVFWLGIACWGACVTGAMIVALDDHGRQVLQDQAQLPGPSVIVVTAPASQ